MKISVVIPAFNEEKLLVQTLQSVKAALRAFERRGWTTELIVCDNNSTDRTAELARSEGAQVVFEPVNQISRARNAGAAAATGDWLIFVDADSCPCPELFDEVAEVILQGQNLGGGSLVHMESTLCWARLACWIWNRISRWKTWMAGSFIFCETRAFRQLGGLSQELFVSEELEFSERLKALARKEGKQVVILHRHPLLTSARKLQLYSPMDYFRLLARAVFTRGRAFKDRSACIPWYDGRR
jgi:glycosyltransferase involved in cell wall biosynthesis